MIEKNGLNFKIGLGFGVIVLLSAVIGGVGWFGIDKLHRQLKAFSVWVEIDTVMHSTITANVAGLKYEISTYTDSPTRNRFEALILSLEQIRKNIEAWQRRFKSNAEIAKTAIRTLEAFKKANENSNRTATLVTQITAASQEQPQGIEQLNETAAEMGRSTQRTAASAQETAFESETLEKQGARIKRTVDDLARLIHGFASGRRSPNVRTEARIVKG